MQIQRWVAQIDDEKVDQQRWEGTRYQRKDKGGGREIAEKRAYGTKEGSKLAGPASSASPDEKSLPFISRSGLLSRPPTSYRNYREIRER